MSIRIPPLAAALALVVAWPAAAQSADGTGAMYRCPGNDYNNTITASEAEKLRCKKVENAAVTVIQSAPGSASAASAPPARPPAAIAEPMSAADSAALRTRASNARRSLEGRLKSEEGRLSVLEKEFNGGEPERRIDEFDFQKYLDRVARMRSAISRKQIEIAELRREIDKLPTQ
ncbi:MAG: hypothetical protein ABI520_17550 [Caldimonas sp.]